jgi:hypothetical protein
MGAAMKGEQNVWKPESGGMDWASGDVRVSVHRHIDEPGRWFVSCHAMCVSRHRLAQLDIHAAQLEAMEVLATRSNDIANRLFAATLALAPSNKES